MDSLEMNPLSENKAFTANFAKTEFDQNTVSSVKQTENEESNEASATDPLPENTADEALKVSTASDSQSSDNMDDKSNPSAYEEKDASDISVTTVANVTAAGQGNVSAKGEGIIFAESQTSDEIMANTTDIHDQKVKSVAGGSPKQSITSSDIKIDVSGGKQSGSFDAVSMPLSSDTKGGISFGERSLATKNDPETSVTSGSSNIASGEKATSIADIISKFQKGESCNEANKQADDPAASSQKPLEMGVKNEKAGAILSEQTDVGKCDIEKPISIVDMQRSFISALNMTSISANEPLKSEIVRKTSTGSAPTIKITGIIGIERDLGVSENSAIENKTDDRAEVCGDSKTDDPIFQTAPSDVESTGTNIAADDQESNSTSVPKSEKKEGEDNGDQERKAFFYLSTSDLPPELNYQSSQDLDVLRYRPSANPVEFRESQQSNRSGSSWLCSKSVHGFIFLAAFIVALCGYILYNLAIKGKVPDCFESVGLTTAIIACIICVISFLCFSILGAFPALPVVEYRRIGDAESLGSRTRIASPLANIDESWSSEMERAFRSQNGMTTSRTSENLLSNPSDRQTLIEKTEKLKNQVTGFLESFIDVVSQMDPVEDLTEMRPVLDDADKARAISPKVSPNGVFLLPDDE